MSIENMKVGDKVCVVTRGGFHGRIYRLEVGEIERVTKTQITAFGRRWMIRTGFEVGSVGSWSRPKIIPYTAEIQNEFDNDKKAKNAERKCAMAGSILSSARGDVALKFSDLAQRITDKHERKDTE
jgi:hypothetical protein